MKPVATPDWLRTTVVTVRELMLKRLEGESPGSEAHREMEMALEELDVMWEELQGQAALLTRENERYAEFFEFAPDAYVVTDAGGNIREINQAALELLGGESPAFLGRPLGAFIPDEERAAFLARWVGLVVAEKGAGATWRGRIVGGAEVEFSIRSIPLRKSGVGGICWLIRPLA